MRPTLAAMPALAALAMLAFVAVPVAAQGGPAEPRLELGDPAMSGQVAIVPAATELMAPWVYSFPDAATAAAALAGDGASITWSLDCGTAPITMAPATTEVPLEAGTTSYQGTAILPVQASPEAPGVEALPCTLHASATGSPTMAPIRDEAPVVVEVVYVGGLRVTVLDDHKASGPQKQIYFPIELENLGNARTQVTFEMLDEPGGKWNAILPEVVLLDAPAIVDGESILTAYLTVATPFSTGYNSDSGTYLVRALPAAARDPSQTAEPVEVEMHASARGWYVPGPSPFLVPLALALVALLARRRL